MHANETTLIHGKLIDGNNGKVGINFFSNENKLEKFFVVFDINQHGEFESVLMIKEAQVVKLKYNQAEIDIYIEPGEKIGLLIDPKNIEAPIQFFEKNNEQNNFIYQDYFSKFGPKKISLTANTSISNDLYNQVKDDKKTSEDKYDLLVKRYNQEKLFYSKIDKGRVSLNFLDFLKSEIRDNHLTYLLKYLDKETLKQDRLKKYFQKTIDENSNSQTIFYISFLESYAHCICEQVLNRDLDYYQDFPILYNCIKDLENFKPESKEELLGRLIYYNTRPEKIKRLTPVFKDYQKHVTNVDFFKEINERYKLGASLQEGQQVPDFKLVDKFGKDISLKNFRGKKVYISFWAKWCGICITKIKNSSEIRKQLKNESIEFVFISIDESKATWKNHSITNDQIGIHLWGGAIMNQLMDNFGIVNLPKDFLIDEQGKFIRDFPNPDTNQFIQFIKSN